MWLLFLCNNIKTDSMFKKISSFRDDDFKAFIEFQNQSQFEIDPFTFPPNLHVDKTNQHSTECGVLKESEQIISRSLKERPGDFQISFESSFMDDHITAFKEKTKNLIEHSLKMENLSNPSFTNPEIFGLDSSAQTFELSQLNILSHLQRKQFEKDMENQQNLREFMKSLAQEVPKEILDELVYAIYLIWECYTKIRKDHFSQRELLKEASKFAEQVAPQLFVGRLTYLNFKQVDQSLTNIGKMEQNFEEFLDFLCCTVFLIIQGYFENPYKTDSKRKSLQVPEWYDDMELSDWSESFLGKSMKRIKQF